MKVLCIGNGSAFAGLLVNELHGRGADVFWLSEKKPNALQTTKKDFVHFPFQAGDANIIHIFRSVLPDVILFLGAQAGPYLGLTQDQANRAMLSDLLHVLELMDVCGIQKLVLFSDEEVFGEGAAEWLKEESPCHPNSSRGECLLDAENIVAAHAQISRRTLITARLSGVYGPQTAMEGAPDFTLASLAKAHAGEPVKASETVRFTPTYLTDAVRGASLLILDENVRSGVYHISSSQDVTQWEFMEELLSKEFVASIQPAQQVASLRLSGRKMSEQFGFQPAFTMQKALRLTREWAMRTNFAYGSSEKHSEIKKKGASRLKKMLRSVFSFFRTFLENISLLAIAAAAALTAPNRSFLSQIDFLFIYVLAISAMRGMQAGTISAILAGAVQIVIFMQEKSLFDVMLDPTTYVRLFVFLAASLFVGHMRDRLVDRAQSTEADTQQLQKRYDDLLAIHEANVEIKSALEKRLLNYGDSFATIYSIISQLDDLEPQSVMQAALGVVERVMHVSDVAIYSINPSHHFMRLEVASSSTSLVLGKTITIAKYPALQEALAEQTIYMNNALTEGYPQMMGFVYINDKPQYALLLWGVAFEHLNVSNRDLLAVVSQLIASSLGKAHQFMDASRRERYDEGTFIMKPAAFEQMIALMQDAKTKNQSDFTLLRIQSVSYQGIPSEDLSGRITSLVRMSDIIGRREDGSFYILLRNTTSDEACVPIKRLMSNGFETEEVPL